MSLSLFPASAAVRTGINVPLYVSGGTAPYVYSVLGGGAGGTVNQASPGSDTATYTAPVGYGHDKIQVQDSLGAIGIINVMVGIPAQILCDILQSELALAAGRVYLWDQKILSPTDNGLFAAVSVLSTKVIGNNLVENNGNLSQYSSVRDTVQIDLISRDLSAVQRKEEALMALLSSYSQSQQELNAMRIFGVPATFTNLSGIDGAAIPYRFSLSVQVFYSISKAKAVPYYDSFPNPQITVEP